MKLSIFTTFTNPEERKDPWSEALECYKFFADEVVVKGSNWPDEFTFGLIGKVFQEGYDECEGDWVVHMDIDNFLHEKDLNRFKKELIKFSDYPAVSYQKFQFFNNSSFSLKSRMLLALNKKKFPNIKLNGGGDLCQPTLNGSDLEISKLPKSYVPIWNYDSIFKSKEIIQSDRARFARAWNREFGNFGNRGGPSEGEAYVAWLNMIEERKKYHVNKIKINGHPIFIQQKLSTLKPDDFGFKNFNLNSQKLTYYQFLREKTKYINFNLRRTLKR